MPAVNIPDDEQTIKPNLLISDVPYVTSVVDTRKEDYDTLATFTAGQKWAVDYYAQVQGIDSASASFQDDLPPTYGQYRLIRGFELVVDSPLSQNQNTSDINGFAMTGSAIVYSVLTPNLGDIFVADIGNGMNGLFQVTSVKRAVIYQESNSTIEYRAIQTVDNVLLSKLNGRAVQVLYFNRENLRDGVKSLLSQEDVDISRRLANCWSRLIGLYMRDFFSERFHTLIMPMQDVPTYDPALTKFVRRILSTMDHPRVIDITELGVAHDIFSNDITLFDAIARRDADLLYSVARKMRVSSIGNYRIQPSMASIYYSGIKQVVSAIDNNYTVNNEGYLPHGDLPIQKAGVRQTDMKSILPVLGVQGQEKMPDGDEKYIKRVVVDDYYVFSEQFYANEGRMSMLEDMVQKRLRNEAINLKDLAELAEYAVKFDNLERYYYIPIILVLIKLAPGVL